MKIREELERLINDVDNEIKRDFFNSPTIIFDNLTMEQWFKVTWLRNNKDKIYMNIKCARLYDLYKMIFGVRTLDTRSTQKFVLDYLKDKSYDADLDYIFDNKKDVNQTRLYDYSKKLASLFIDYENYNFNPTDYQKDIYDNVIKKAKEKNIYSLKELSNSNMNKLESKVFVFVTRKLLPLEEMIINEYNKQYDNGILLYNAFDYEYKLQNINLKSAPSKLREIEILHSDICKLIKDDKAKLSDIVVYAPKIDDYQAEVARVFKQTDTDYPNVPYVLSSPKRNDLLDGINTIFKIIKNGYATRLDFVNLVSNKEIVNEWHLADKDVDTIISTIIDSNTYRNSELYGNDFKILKERLLLSKLVGSDATLDNLCNLSDTNVPFDTISLDDNLKSKLIELIDLVLRLIQIKPEDKLNDQFGEIESILLSFFNKNNSSKLYRKIAIELLSLKDFEFDKSDKLTVEVLFYSLLDGVKFNVSSGLPFSTGVTFLNMSNKNVVSAKYTFIIGMSSKNYPRVEVDSELNQNKNKKANNETITDIDRDTFTNILNNSENLFISYVNKDLKKDEDFYPSVLLKEYNYKDVKFSIDEKKRSYEELYTKREFKNKDYYKSLMSSSGVIIPFIPTTYKSQELPEKVSLITLRDYLKTPLKTKADQLFGIYDDETIDEINTEYEPFHLNTLDSSIYKEQILSALFNGDSVDEVIEAEALKNKLPRYKFNNLEIDELIDSMDSISDMLKDEGYKQFVLPDINLEYNKKELLNYKKDFFTEISAECHSDLEAFEKKVSEKKAITTKDEGKLVKMTDMAKSFDDAIVEINDYSGDDEKVNWTVITNNKKYYKKIEDSVVYASLKGVYELYVISLIDIVGSQYQDDEIIDVLLCPDLEAVNKKTYPFRITKTEAKYILNKTYYDLNDYQNNIILNIKIEGEKIQSKYDLFTGIWKGFMGPWQYYGDKTMFGVDDLFNVVKDGKVLESDSKELKEAYSNSYLELLSLVYKISKK